MITIDGKPINITYFPDGTSQVWKIDEEILKLGGDVVWDFESENEIMQILQLDAILSVRGILTSLYIPFLPYGRQDKEISNETTFGLILFAKILNSTNYLGIKTFDVHSGTAKSLIERLENITPEEEIYMSIAKTGANVVCYPDSGAARKYSDLIKFPKTSCDKIRDQKTGYISSIKLHGDVKDKSVLIVDDICDGGMTFVLTAKKLIEVGAKEVNLYVSHGIFSKGLGPLKCAGINRIFTKEGEIGEVQGNIVFERFEK